jgi:hypothetical protein
MTGINWNALALFKRKKKEEEETSDAPQPSYLMVRAVNNQIYNIKVPDSFLVFGYEVEVRDSDGECVYRARNINLQQWLIDLHTQPAGMYYISIHSGLQSLMKKIEKH